VPFGPYTVDFCSHSAKLIIEVDGGQHATEAARDEERTRVLQSEGYRVLRFWNNDVLSNIDGVVHRIAEEISTSPSHSFAAGPALSHGRGKVVPCQ
jgi:crossover junction endodeoxyribonuclease RuvC